MTKEEIYTFLNTNPEFFISTIDGDKPRVRGLLLHKADENGIIFTTAKIRDLYKQLKKNPHVEMAFYNGKDIVQVRVSGTVEEFDDLEVKKDIVSKRPFLKPAIERIGYEPMAVFRATNLVATPWELKTTMAPKMFINI